MSRSSAALVLALAAIAAVALPLATYAISLALFGAAHAIVELRLLEARYRPRLGRDVLMVVLAALTAVFVARVGANLGGVGRFALATTEIVAALAMLIALLPRFAGAGVGRRSIVAIVGVALVLGLAYAPMHVLLASAVLHNLTPWGLLADAAPSSEERRRIAGTGALVFVAVPLVIASGLPFAALARMGMVAPEATPLDLGGLDQAMGAFLPTSWTRAPELALHAFSACAYLQCAHYVAVLGLLPRRMDAAIPPARRVGMRWVGGVIAAGMLLVVAYAVDFAGTRAWYGTIAGVHAWAELPALLLALAASPAAQHGEDQELGGLRREVASHRARVHQ